MLPYLPESFLLQWSNGNIENSEPSAITEVMNKIWVPRKGKDWSDGKNIEYLTSELNVSWLCRVSICSHFVDRECTERHFRQGEFNKHSYKNGCMPAKKLVM